MSRRLILVALALTATVVNIPEANGGWKEFKHQVALVWHRNNAWPQPWVNVDRMATCRIFDLQAQNGWCQQSTLTSFHFNPDTHELTEAGRNRVRQILTQHPTNFRTLFVVMGEDEKTTVGRVDSVQQVAMNVAGDGALPDIRRVAIAPRGWPADEVNTIALRLQESMPVPRIQKSNTSLTTN